MQNRFWLVRVDKSESSQRMSENGQCLVWVASERQRSITNPRDEVQRYISWPRSIQPYDFWTKLSWWEGTFNETCINVTLLVNRYLWRAGSLGQDTGSQQ